MCTGQGSWQKKGHMRTKESLGLGHKSCALPVQRDIAKALTLKEDAWQGRQEKSVLASVKNPFEAQVEKNHVSGGQHYSPGKEEDTSWNQRKGEYLSCKRKSKICCRAFLKGDGEEAVCAEDLHWKVRAVVKGDRSRNKKKDGEKEMIGKRGEARQRTKIIRLNQKSLSP